MVEFEGLVLLHLWEEMERGEVQRNVNLRQRHLHDITNPFEIPDPLFIQFFRLPRDVVRNLVNEISPHLPIIYRRNAIPAHLKILTALNFYAMGSYQKNVGHGIVTASMSQPSISRCIKEVTEVIVNHLVQTWIKFPTREEVHHVKEQFLQHFQIPGVIGCIDATHIAIVSPPVEDPVYPALAYYNRKGFYSLSVQIIHPISDAELRVRSIHAGYSGSTHDSAIWNGSAIKRHLHQRFDLYNSREWLLGDAGYPLQPFLLTPILNVPDDTAEERYTARHLGTRNSVERTIGVLKQPFRCLLKHRVLHYHPTTASKIIYACAVLHNICRFYNIPLPDHNLPLEGDGDPIYVHDEENVNAGNSLIAGQRVRRTLIRDFFS